MAEYFKRLKAVGVRPEAPFFDEIVCTPEQAESTTRIFCELCEERGLKVKEDGNVQQE